MTNQVRHCLVPKGFQLAERLSLCAFCSGRLIDKSGYMAFKWFIATADSTARQNANDQSDCTMFDEAHLAPHWQLQSSASSTPWRSGGVTSPIWSAMIVPSQPGCAIPVPRTGSVYRSFNFMRWPASWAATHGSAPPYHVPRFPRTNERPSPAGTLIFDAPLPPILVVTVNPGADHRLSIDERIAETTSGVAPSPLNSKLMLISAPESVHLHVAFKPSGSTSETGFPST